MGNIYIEKLSSVNMATGGDGPTKPPVKPQEVPVKKPKSK